MTITLSQHDHWELFQDIEQQTASSADEFSITWKYPQQLGRGYWCEMRLREGLELAIDCFQLHEPVIIQLPERSHPLEYSFHLAACDRNAALAGQYLLCGSGLAPVEIYELPATE